MARSAWLLCSNNAMMHSPQGDQLIATSGYTYERETQYQSVQVRSGERVVRLTARGEVRILPVSPPPHHFCTIWTCQAGLWCSRTENETEVALLRLRQRRTVISTTAGLFGHHGSH